MSRPGDAVDRPQQAARSVEDVALLLEVMTGQFTNNISEECGVLSHNALEVTNNKPWKLGVLKQHFFDKAAPLLHKIESSLLGRIENLHSF